MEQAFCEGPSMDDDFVHLLETRPDRFAASMLKSQKAQVQRREQERQNLIHAECQAQREQVLAAQWNFFKTALKSDHLELVKVKNVPSAVKNKLHQKTVSARKQQADAGQRATQGYQDPELFLRKKIGKWEHQNI